MPHSHHSFSVSFHFGISEGVLASPYWLPLHNLVKHQTDRHLLPCNDRALLIKNSCFTWLTEKLVSRKCRCKASPNMSCTAEPPLLSCVPLKLLHGLKEPAYRHPAVD